MEKYGHVYGVYAGLKPTLTISDVELVKKVMIKDFHLFVNRRDFKVLDKMWKTNLFMIHDEDWKRIRSITAPAFTSGKLRKMFPLLKEATDKLEIYLNSVCNKGETVVDIKAIVTGFTIDVIASTSFGTDTDANGDRTKYNPFLHHAPRLFRDVSLFRLTSQLSLPVQFLKLFNIKHFFPYDSFEFFKKVSRTMLERGGAREDFIKILKEASISDEELENMNYDKLTATSGGYFQHTY